MDVTNPNTPEGQPKEAQPVVPDLAGVSPEANPNQPGNQRPVDGIMPQSPQAFPPDRQIADQGPIVDENTIPTGNPPPPTLRQEPVIPETTNRIPPIHPVDSSFGGNPTILEGVIGSPLEEVVGSQQKMVTTPPIAPDAGGSQIPEEIVAPNDQEGSPPPPDIVVTPDQYDQNTDNQDPVVPLQTEVNDPIMPASIPPAITYEGSVVNTTAEVPPIKELKNRELIEKLAAAVNSSLEEAKNNMEKLIELMEKFNFDTTGLGPRLNPNDPDEKGKGEL